MPSAWRREFSAWAMSSAWASARRGPATGPGAGGSRAVAGSSRPTSTRFSRRATRCRCSPNSSDSVIAVAKPAWAGCLDKEVRVGQDKAEADGGEETPLLPPGGGGLALAARRPVHRTPRVLRSDDGPCKGEHRRGPSRAVAPAGRSAERSRKEPVEAGGDS